MKIPPDKRELIISRLIDDHINTIEYSGDAEDSNEYVRALLYHGGKGFKKYTNKALMQAYEAAGLSERFAEVKVEVEYDREYSGGNYSGVGTLIILTVESEDGNLPAKNVHTAFQAFTGVDPIHIVHWEEKELDS